MLGSILGTPIWVLFCIMPVYTFALHVNSHRIVLKPTVLKRISALLCTWLNG